MVVATTRFYAGGCRNHPTAPALPAGVAAWKDRE